MTKALVYHSVYGHIETMIEAVADQAGGLRARDALVGKVGAAFTSTASQHGGQETTLFSCLTTPEEARHEAA